MKKILILAAVFAALMLGSCKEILWNNIIVANDCNRTIMVNISKPADMYGTYYTITEGNSNTFYLDNGGDTYDIWVKSGDGSDVKKLITTYISKNGTFIISHDGTNYSYRKSW